MSVAPQSTVKVISYQDSYVPVPGIRVHSRWQRTTKVFLIIISVAAILMFIKSCLINEAKSNNVSTTKELRHSNPCRHVTPEPEIILQEKFDSNDYFFPYSYKERICAVPNKTTATGTELDELQTCFTDKYHCVTRYKRFQVVRIPFPGNLTSRLWKFEQIHVAVACECSQTEIVKTYGT